MSIPLDPCATPMTHHGRLLREEVGLGVLEASGHPGADDDHKDEIDRDDGEMMGCMASRIRGPKSEFRIKAEIEIRRCRCHGGLRASSFGFFRPRNSEFDI